LGGFSAPGSLTSTWGTPRLRLLFGFLRGERVFVGRLVLRLRFGLFGKPVLIESLPVVILTVPIAPVPQSIKRLSPTSGPTRPGLFLGFLGWLVPEPATAAGVSSTKRLSRSGLFHLRLGHLWRCPSGEDVLDVLVVEELQGVRKGVVHDVIEPLLLRPFVLREG